MRKKKFKKLCLFMFSIYKLGYILNTRLNSIERKLVDE